ncbi:MAG: restriction endonuclease subunit S [Spirosomataceae bacterium]
MSEWKEYNLNEVYDFASGLSKGASEFGFGHGFLGFKDVFHNFFAPDELTSLVNSTEKEQESCSIKRGDVFLTRTSETDEDLGMSCVALKDYPKATFNGFTKRLRPKGNVEILPEYAGFYFRSPKFRGTVSGMSSITTRASLNNSMLAQLTIDVPPIEEQKAIADTLFSLYRKIELLEQQNKTIEQLVETLFRKWCLDNEDLGLAEIKFGDLVQPKKGKNLTKSEAIEGDYPVVAGGLEPSCYHNEANTQSPVVTISASGANAGYVRLYHTPIWSSDSSYIDETITPFVFFSYLLLKSKQLLLFDKQEGSAQPHIYPRHIMELEILNYPIKRISEFEGDIKPLFNKIKSNQIQIRTLTQSRNTLLPKIINREVSVSI